MKEYLGSKLARQISWRKLTAPRSTDEDEARREYMTKVILVIMSAIMLAVIPLSIIAWSVGVFSPGGPIVVMLLSVFFSGGWWLAQRGHWRLGGYIPPIAIFSIALFDTYTYGVGGTNIMEYTIGILLTAMLQGSRARWIALGLSIGASMGLEWLWPRRYPELEWTDLVYWAVALSAFYASIALLLRFFASQFERALAQSRAYAAELAQEIVGCKQVEEALRGSEEKFRSVVENSHNGILIVDDAYQFTYVNDELCRILGYLREEIIGQDFRNFLDDESKYLVASSYVLKQRGEEPPPRYEFNVVRKNGEKRRVEISSTVIKDPAGQVRTVAQLLDITERKQAEAALQKSERRYRTLVTQVPIGVVTCDLAGNITHVNLALSQILGSPSEETTRRFNLLTMPNLVEAGISAAFRRCMEETTQITAEYHYCSYWGQESILRVRLTCLRDESGAVSGALATVEDVTEQRRLQEQLIQSAKLASIGELAAGVAHEINNPINGIINYAQLLLNEANRVNEVNETEPGSRKARFLEGILREGDRVAGIVRDLLTFARVEEEAHSLVYVPDILRATLTLTSRQLERDGILLEVEEQPNLPQVRCRSQRIQQVFLNLISNARSAINARYLGSDPNKRLIIRVEQVEKEGQPYVRITFHDCGVGISAHNLPRIFTPFFTTKRPGEGTGLGLSVSYGIVQDHHGDIQVESVEGEYTIFQVGLPVEPGWEI